jgi:hypothetical protein
MSKRVEQDYKSLVEAGRKSIATYPNGWSSHYFLAVGYEGSGRLMEAVEPGGGHSL